MSSSRFMSEIFSCLSNSDATSLAKVLSLKNPQYKNLYFSDEDKNQLSNRLRSASNDIYNWAEMINFYVLFRNSLAKEDFITAFDFFSKALKSLNELVKDAKEENWQLPVLFRMSVDLRLYAYTCDAKKQRNQLFDKSSGTSATSAMLASRADDADGGAEYKANEYAEKTAEIFMASFRILSGDTRVDSQVSKRWGVMHIVNQLFKIYFKINKVNLCNPLKRVIENSNLRDAFPQSHQVVYKFYVGRQAMFENDFNTAATYFTYAFDNCPSKFKRNKRLILIYLIPVNMLRGFMPARSLLLKYDLEPFAQIVEAVKRGNIVQFNEAMAVYEDFFIENGVYLFLEKLRMTTYRNLFKTVARLLALSQIPIEAFVDVLKLLRDEVADSDACQCILANLIYEGKIKGYISYKHNKLVISRDFKNAFPRLSTLSSA